MVFVPYSSSQVCHVKLVYIIKNIWMQWRQMENSVLVHNQIMTVTSWHIIRLFDFQTHQSWTWFWSSSAWWSAPLLSQLHCCWCGWPTVAGQSGCSIRQLHQEPAAAVCAEEVTWSYRDQGGTAANYTDHVPTKIAADNYISQQTVSSQSY